MIAETNLTKKKKGRTKKSVNSIPSFYFYLIAMENLSAEDKCFLAQCEEEFKDRYTENDEDFMKVFNAETMDPPIVENWRASQNYGRRNDNRRYARSSNRHRSNRDRGYRDRSYHGRGDQDREYQERGYQDRGYCDRSYEERGYQETGYPNYPKRPPRQ
ncbi:unnamed protein product, partial [Iphiclides podalirius]